MRQNISVFQGYQYFKEVHPLLLYFVAAVKSTPTLHASYFQCRGTTLTLWSWKISQPFGYLILVPSYFVFPEFWVEYQKLHHQDFSCIITMSKTVVYSTWQWWVSLFHGGHSPWKSLNIINILWYPWISLKVLENHWFWTCDPVARSHKITPVVVSSSQRQLR